MMTVLSTAPVKTAETQYNSENKLRFLILIPVSWLTHHFVYYETYMSKPFLITS